MAVPFGSLEWLQSLQEELNKSAPYEEAARNWEGDFYFIVEPDGPVTEPMYLYMDLWHGKAREVALPADKNAKKPAYILSGSYGKWKKVVTGKLDPIQAMMTGQMKMKGNMPMILKHIKAAQEIIKACNRIDTEFPA